MKAQPADDGGSPVTGLPIVFADGSEKLSSIEFRINRRPNRLPEVSCNGIDRERYIENRKSTARRKAEQTYSSCVFLGCIDVYLKTLIEKYEDSLTYATG